MATAERISEAFLLPVLETLLDGFPFQILGFHADNGSEHVNRKVAELLDELNAEFTKSRPRHSNDNALAETKTTARPHPLPPAPPSHAPAANVSSPAAPHPAPCPPPARAQYTRAHIPLDRNDRLDFLDTHIWLWYAEGVTERLRPASVKKLDNARKGDGLVVSAISIREIGTHSAKGRIQLAVPLRDWVEKALDVPGIRLAPLDAAAAAESTLLPGEPHGDPADRFLIATARTQGVALATRDERIVKYAKLGFLRVVEL